MLLWLSSCRRDFGCIDVCAGEGLVDLSGEVAFEASQDVFGRQLFSCSASTIGACLGVGGQSGASDHAQGTVGLAVTAAG
ncbi:hypothetical protein A4G26_20350 [Mycobacterium kansasii]|nr:hypothetical protein A4G26_20350 [Mycobacterium kansasii]